MRIMGIETSCDDTCIAVIEFKKGRDFKILSNTISSQDEVHEKWGGIYPTLAKREHQKNLPLVLKKTLKKIGVEKKTKKIQPESKEGAIGKILEKESDLKKETLKILKTVPVPKIDKIAVTSGPGLEPCLWAGINFSKALSYYWDKPIFPVNHIESHLLISFYSRNKNNFTFRKKKFPIIALIASGGHTQIVLIKKIGDYKSVGETRDDAAGECFDKAARIVGLGYPGGPAIAEQARLWKPSRLSAKQKKDIGASINIKLPRPMINSGNFDFSFSGLKTAILYHHQSLSPRIQALKEYRSFIAHETQQAIIDVLITKTLRAAEKYSAKSIILGGGVTANKELQRQFIKKSKIKLSFPPKETQTDNAIMIAVTAKLAGDRKKSIKLEAHSNLRI